MVTETRELVLFHTAHDRTVFVQPHALRGHYHFSCLTVVKSVHLQANTKDISNRELCFGLLFCPSERHLPAPYVLLM